MSVNPQASSFFAFDPSDVGHSFPTVAVMGSVDQCLPEFRTFAVSMTQNGKPIAQVSTGTLGQGQIDYCNTAGGVDLSGLFGGSQLLLEPGKATVTFSIYGAEGGPIVVGSGTVIIPSHPKDGRIRILPLSTPAKTVAAPGTSTPTKRIRVGAVISHCTPGVTYTLAAAALPSNFARTASDSTDHPVRCPRSGRKAVALTFYGETFTARKAPFIFMLTGPDGLNWDTRSVTIPRR